MTVFSVLDLSPIVEGSDAAQALANTLDLAQHAERWGYHRYWLAEHHNMPGIASAATSIVIAHVAAGTRSIRVGAGGIMLPNHSPLVVAEQFGTLATLFPGRIDLGVGRAPGTDPLTMRALRRGLDDDVRAFPDNVVELLRYFQPVAAGQRVRAVPGAGLDVPIWILGSSTFGAHLAAVLGLPYAFASHFAPAQLSAAIELYRREFKPSAALAAPYVMLGINVVAAETDAEARFHLSSLEQAFINLRRGAPGELPLPQAGYADQLLPIERAGLDDVLRCAAIGSPATVERRLREFIGQTSADELIVTAMVHDHRARLRSYELVAQIAKGLEGG
ncbi:MAG TPA: LLM class flavin-dependent oxidoreductase [Polyangiaceae bacterium]|nr:LLM class flavin-dependent oxidoreductase [Polyangiaceae bacterium]